MSILLWITIEIEYKIKCLTFILFFTNGRQKLTAKGLSRFMVGLLLCYIEFNILLAFFLSAVVRTEA